MSGLDPLVAAMTELNDVQLERFLLRVTPHRRSELTTRFKLWAHDGQTIADQDWTVWLIQAGRGFGKTRAGSEWVCAQAAERRDLRIALVGATRRDVESVMVRGPAGLLAIGRHYGPVTWRPSRGVVEFGSGAEAHVYAAESPEGLRGPEHHVAWCDELAKWRNADATWDNLMMGMRMGERPQTLVTTTPRVIPLLRRIRAMPGVRISGGRSRDNRHLSESYFAQIEGAYAGTRLGRQELDGELIEDVAGALWERAVIEARRVVRAPALVRVVVGVDPPAGIGGDACGIVAVGKGADGFAYVLEDASVSGLSPEGWAAAVAACAARHSADRVVAEANQGGAMVASVLRAADAGLPVRLVHASRGKVARAEPVAALYTGARAFHVGAFPALEDELCGLVTGGGYEGPGRSPDRADALVWAMFELMLSGRGEAVVRVL
ncbi:MULTISPECIES: DNA-packaging protein [unclassified Sphingomonas]|uniref:DNA-packaging protein n=1 Tax=unclassified Sphingomonas TaxID=196159 RepID=UPI00070027D9|nr:MULTISPECIES: terminase family protein [unclassified Sphingomonas]KQM24858.1 ATP-binding protein [Sphingomonas sp. Leaf9]KQM42516.1 ATP-binding protein [Sphingomonas sp. Leaf11]